MSGKKNLSISLEFFRIFAPLGVLVLILSAFVMSFQRSVYRDKIALQESNILLGEKQIFESNLSLHISDLLFLSELTPLHFQEERTTGLSTLDELNNEFLMLAQARNEYDQIRYIDNSGQEKVRVNQTSDGAKIVPSQELQNKSDRPYFIKGIALGKNELYVSQIDLNVEGGVIEKPIKPMIRLITPIFNKTGTKLGIIVLNYKAEHLLNRLRNAALESNNPIYLINSEGYWLIGPTPGHEWNFMFKDKKSKLFKDLYADAWRRISSADNGQYFDSERLFTYRAIDPFEKEMMNQGNYTGGHSEEYWIMISIVEPRNLNPLQWQFTAWLSGCILILLAFVNGFWAKSRVGRKKAEEEIRELNKELEQKVKDRTIELEKAKNIAEASNSAKSVFLTNISHEIRTPMNSIIGFSDILEQTTIDDQQKEYLKSIKSSTVSLLALINDVIDLSKVESGDLELEYSFVNLYSIISDIKTEFFKPALNKKIDYIEDIEDKLPKFIYTDKARLSQILENIVGNAVKFTSSGYVKLSLSCRNHNHENSVFDFVIIVEDTGIGIPEDQQENIFGSFNQLTGNDQYKYGGVGLGLAITQKLVNSMNGEISVESTVGKGSIFRIEFKEVKITDTPENGADSEEITAEIEKLDELESETPVELSPAIIQKLPELLQILEEEFTPIFEELKDSLSIDEIEEFGTNILNIGKSYNYLPLINWGKKLTEQAGAFEIDSMTDTFSALPDIIKDIKDKI